jgi:hypothetical protein
MIPRRSATLAALVALGASAGCASPPAPKPEPPPALRELATPARDGAGEPHLAALPDGRALLSWVDPAPGGHALRMATRDAGGEWSEPFTVAEGDDWFVNWADFPSVNATPDGTLFAHWLARSGAGTYAYDVVVSISRDAGASWGEPFVLHRDGTVSEHGFVSMVPAATDRMGLVWLDGRHTVDAAGELRSHGERGAEMSLYYTSVAADGTRGEEASLDSRVCDCCQTAAARAGDTLLVAYRDRSPEEIRDTALVRLLEGGWTPPAGVVAEGWRIDGCPVNGPGLDADARGRSAIAWFSAPDERPAVRVAFSADAGARWSEGSRVDEGRPLGRVDVVLLEDGSALVSWLEQAEAGARVLLRRTHPDGSQSEARVVSSTGAARSSGFPRLVAVGDELVVAWRDDADPPRVRTAVGRLPS